jgi:cytochrome P450
MLEGLLVEQQRSFNPKESLDNERGRLASWLLQHYDSPSEVPVQVLCKDHILALFAGIHIATNAVTQVLIDLAARPEYQTPLLEEIESVLGKADERRDTTLADIARMSKLDSFIKESLYVNPPGGVGQCFFLLFASSDPTFMAIFLSSHPYA